MIASNLIIAVSFVVIAQIPGQPSPSASKAGFVAHPVSMLKAPEDSPMIMPTAVAVAPSGRVFIADGVNDRIVEFDETGRFFGGFQSIASERLSRPIGVHVDAQGTLWVADTGNARVLARDSSGKLSRVIPVPDGADLTDIAKGPEEILWLIDNDGHRVIRHNLGTGEFSPYGRQGDARGQFQYPFMAAVDGSGMLYVTDVINGRVQGVRDFDTIPRVIGSYGVEPGQFHRPKGIAIDSSGRILVVDGSLGVVQFFAADGTYLDVLREVSGKILHFESPCGIAMDREAIYVTEMLPGRVQKLRLEVNEVKPSFEPPRRPQPHTQPSTCTACHLEWMPHFSSGAPSELAAPPPSRPDEPYVSSVRSCASCHDGSVDDSRKKVWRDHGHNVGILPPAGMSVPQELPLVDGKLACRTCHSAHTQGGAGQTMKDAVFLRVSEHPDELCIRCHSDYQGQRGSEMHPTKGFAEPLHPDLLAAGARYSFKPSASGCLICHTGHGSRADRLLVPLAGTDQMCASCHSQVTQMSDVGDHPVTALLSPIQQANVGNMGGGVASGGQLQCLSCHKVHHAKVVPSLLVRSLEGSALCMGCHSDYQSVFGSLHDLSKDRSEQDAGAAECQVAGPCAACHGVHTPPQPPVTAPGDASGRCVTCHREGACAGDRTGAPFAHPSSVAPDLLAELATMTGKHAGRSRTGNPTASLECADCHNPHGSVHPQLLRARPDDLCSTCHDQQTPIFGGVHDIAQYPEMRNGKSAAASQTGSCGFCHSVHQPLGAVLWSATSTPPADASALCLECHQSNGLAHPPRRLVHPVDARDPAVIQSPIEEGQRLQEKSSAPDPACTSCHDPHQRGEGPSAAMLRVKSGGSDHQYCVTCHPQAGIIEQSPHQDLAALVGVGRPAACAPCHAMHERPAESDQRWALTLGDSARCTSCHADSGLARMPHYVPHLPLTMVSLNVDGPGFMPLVDEHGLPGRTGTIACVTCHVPHGRMPGGGFHVPVSADSATRSALKMMLRPYVAPNLCSSCHGFDGLRRFLYFHSTESSLRTQGE